MSESADPDDAARLEDGALHLLGKVRVTCQRCRRPFDHIYHAPPRSLGLLPIGREAEGEFLVPLADDEAFWLGLKSPVASVSVVLFAETKNWGRLNVRSGRPAEKDDGSAFVVSAYGSIQGILRDAQSWWPFQRGPAERAPICQRLIFLSRAAPLAGAKSPAPPAILRLVTYEELADRADCRRRKR